MAQGPRKYQSMGCAGAVACCNVRVALTPACLCVCCGTLAVQADLLRQRLCTAQLSLTPCPSLLSSAVRHRHAAWWAMHMGRVALRCPTRMAGDLLLVSFVVAMLCTASPAVPPRHKHQHLPQHLPQHLHRRRRLYLRPFAQCWPSQGGTPKTTTRHARSHMRVWGVAWKACGRQ